MKMYYVGKTYPLHTSCIMFVNEVPTAMHTVVKHHKDNNNQEFAYKLCAAEVIAKLNSKLLRKEVWKAVFNVFKKYKLWKKITN